VPGLEAAGVVDEIGDGVTGVQIGDEVFGSAVGGAAAEYTLLDYWAAKPAAMSWAEAGGLPMAVETAARGLDLFGTVTGLTVLVSGASGGVGTAAVQFAIARGATVVATGSEHNQEYLTSLGAIATTYGPGLPERVLALVPGGVDRALDIAGHGVLPDLISLTGSVDYVGGIGDYAGSAAAGVAFTTGSEGRAFYSLAAAAELFTQGRFTMPVDRTFALTEIGEAHRISEAGHVRGKLVVVLA
jgi:NADPH:quinone reductase-like Zn-dependent oxidoreductase